MKVSERRQLTRLSLRTPLRFRALGVASDKTEHFTEAVTGNSAQEMRCTARVVHVRNEPYGDGRIGFGAEIEKFQTVPPHERWVS